MVALVLNFQFEGGALRKMFYLHFQLNTFSSIFFPLRPAQSENVDGVAFQVDNRRPVKITRQAQDDEKKIEAS